jgi:hypothetical protein
MTTIRIDPDYARTTGRRLIAESDRLSEICTDLRRAIYSLDTWAWDGKSRLRAEPLLGQVGPRGMCLTEDLYDLGLQLCLIAEVFEECEHNALSGIAHNISWDKTAQVLAQDRE